MIWRRHTSKKKKKKVLANLSIVLIEFSKRVYWILLYESGYSLSMIHFKKVIERTYFSLLFSFFLDSFHDFLLGERSRLKTVVTYVTIRIDALSIKMNLCQGLINYVLICQLPTLQGNCNHFDKSSIIPSLFLLVLNSAQLRTSSAFNSTNLLEYHRWLVVN